MQATLAVSDRISRTVIEDYSILMILPNFEGQFQEERTNMLAGSAGKGGSFSQFNFPSYRTGDVLLLLHRARELYVSSGCFNGIKSRSFLSRKSFPSERLGVKLSLLMLFVAVSD